VQAGDDENVKSRALPEPLSRIGIDEVSIPGKHRFQGPRDPNREMLVYASHQRDSSPVEGAQYWIARRPAKYLNQKRTLNRSFELVPASLEKVVKIRRPWIAVRPRCLQSDQDADLGAISQFQPVVFATHALAAERHHQSGRAGCIQGSLCDLELARANVEQHAFRDRLWWALEYPEETDWITRGYNSIFHQPLQAVRRSPMALGRREAEAGGDKASQDEHSGSGILADSVKGDRHSNKQEQ
jgi:hypothetical protein